MLADHQDKIPQVEACEESPEDCHVSVEFGVLNYIRRALLNGLCQGPSHLTALPFRVAPILEVRSGFVSWRNPAIFTF